MKAFLRQLDYGIDYQDVFASVVKMKSIRDLPCVGNKICNPLGPD